jgi:hypothetical protein
VSRLLWVMNHKNVQEASASSNLLTNILSSTTMNEGCLLRVELPMKKDKVPMQPNNPKDRHNFSECRGRAFYERLFTSCSVFGVHQVGDCLAASLRIIEQDFGIGEVAKLIAGHTHIKDANPLEQPMCWVGSIAKSRSDNPRLALCVNAIKEIVAAMRDDRRRLRREISTSVEVQGEMANRFPKLMIHPDERLVAHNRCAEFIAPITPNSPMKLDEGGGVNKASITIGSEKDKDQLAKELFVPDALALAKAFLSRLPGGRAFGIAAILYII